MYGKSLTHGTTVTIGIDPGLRGAIAIMHWHRLVYEEGVSVHDMPIIESKPKTGKTHREYDVAAIRRILSEYAKVDTYAALEHQSAFPGQGVTSMFHLGQAFGLWKGILGALGIPYTVVTPVSWKRKYGLLGKGKQESRILCMRQYPQVDLSKKKHDGRADALLLAQYVEDVILERGRSQE